MAAATLVLLATLQYPHGLWGLDERSARSLGILIFTIILWVSRAIPLSVTSLLAVGLLITTGVAETFVEAAQGFASDTVFFLLSATLIAQGVANAGLIERVARFSARLSGARPKRAVWLVAGLTGATALIMPSALVRTKAFIPVAQKIAKLLGDKQEQVRFLTATGLVMALLGHVASISVMTGGGMSIVAAGTIAEFHRPLTWLQWLVMMSVPGVLIMLVMVLVILRLFPIRATFASTTGAHERPAGFSRREAFTMIVLAGTLGMWLLGEQWNLPLAVPAILAATIFALPPVGLVTKDSIQRQNWDEILVVGSGLSLGAMLSETGAIAWLAGHALELLPQNPGQWVVYLFTMVFAFLVRQLFLAPSPGMVIILPIVIELGRVTGVDPLLLAMLAAGVIGAVQVLPIQSPPALLCVLNGLYSTRDQLRLAPYFLLVIAGIMLGAVMLYWPLLQVWGWIP